MDKLKGKKIIVTAGPVWVPIDQMRVLTNIFGGSLGYVVAQELSDSGAEVVLLMGPGRIFFSGKEKFKVEKFKYYEEIYKILKEKIGSGKYDAIIHSSAIPDYLPIKKKPGKIKSGKKELVIKLKPTVKIIDQFKKWDPEIFVVKFKLEVGKTKKQLIDVAYKSMMNSKADLMVANELAGVKKKHIAYLIDKNKKVTNLKGREQIAKKLVKKIF